MKATAYFHPIFGEEVAALPSKTRIALYLFIMEQERLGPLSTDFTSYKFHGTSRRRLHSWFVQLDDNFVACFDTRAAQDGFTYLHLGTLPSPDHEEPFLNLCAERIASLENEECELLRLDNFLHQGEKEDVEAALDVIVKRENRLLNLHCINEAKKDTKANITALFNLSPTQYSRLETKLDFYLSTFQKSLTQNGLTLTLQINAKDGTSFYTSSLQEISSLK